MKWGWKNDGGKKRRMDMGDRVEAKSFRTSLLEQSDELRHLEGDSISCVPNTMAQ